MDDKELIRMIRKCRLADLGDGMDALGLVGSGTMNRDMRPIRPGIEFAGYAFTVRLLPAQTPVRICADYADYKVELKKWCSDTYTFMKELTPETCPDTVVVVDMGGFPGGLWGSENGASTKIKGVAGVVLDGGCRDSYECNLENINVFCTERTFNHVYGRLVNGGFNMPVRCAGVLVNPGDIVCADDDGVLVIPRNRAEEVLRFALGALEDDQKVRARHYDALGYARDDTLDRMNTR